MGNGSKSGRQPVNSGLSSPKDVGSEILTSDLAISGALDRGPVLGIQERLALDPVRDGLLADSFHAGELSDPSGQVSLALTAELDRPLQGGDVVGNGKVCFLHGREEYTRILVAVNKESCFTGNKDPCTVISMNSVKAKRARIAAQPVAAPKKRKKPPTIGADGLTAKQRLHRLMEERGIGQTQLARMISEYYGAFVPGVDERFKQQHIGNFILNEQDTADWLVIAAKIFEVNSIWLQFGIGKKEIQ